MPERLNAGRILAALGAVALFVSLFLDWYEPGFSAWTVFEIVDLLLAVLAIVILVIALEDVLGRRWFDVGRWMPWLAVAALLLVLVSILNNPPAANGRSEEVGAWIALAGAILIAAGAILSDRQISIVVSSRPREGTPGDRGAPRTPTGPAMEPKGDETKTRPMNPIDPA